MTSTEPGSTTAVVEVVDDLPGEFAERIVESFHYRRGEYFHLGLTGGDVAQRCYERLASHAETQIDWWMVDLWWVDDLDVAPEHPASHYGMAKRRLLSHVGAAFALHPLPTHDLPDRLDIAHLDMAADGTLSWVGAPGRLTLPLTLVPQTELVLITAAGEDRREAVTPLLANPAAVVARFAPSRVALLVDRAAAG